MLSDRKSRISFGSSDVGFRGDSSRVNIRKIGRMYTSPSMDRLNSMDRSASAMLSRAKSIYDISTSSTRFDTTTSMSSPIAHRNTRYQNVRTNVWRQSESFKTLKNRHDFVRSRHDLHSNDGFSGISSMTQPLTGSRYPDPIAVLDRRDQFFSQLNAISSPKYNRRNIPTLTRTSAVRYHWPGSSTFTEDSWRPRLRERPLLSKLSTKIGSRSKKSPGLSSNTSSISSAKVDESDSPERRESDAGIYRNKYIIKFREHNLGQTPSQRRSSITWDLPKAFTSVKGSDESPISEQLEPDPHLDVDDAESESVTDLIETVSDEINESDNSGSIQNQIKDESKQSERVSQLSGREVKANEDKRVLSETKPTESQCDVTQLVTDIISVQTVSVMPEPSGAPAGPVLQRASSLKSSAKSDTNADKVPKTKSPKKKKVKKKDQTIKDKVSDKEEEKPIIQKKNKEDVSPNVIEIKVQKDINENIVTESVIAPKRIRFRKYTFDDFNLLNVLGRGSFGKVFLAELKDHNVFFAIKCLKKHSVIEDDDIDSIMIERKVLAYGSTHPFICKLFCTFQTDSYLCFAMEWCCGGDLMFHVQKFGKLDEDKARFYACEILCAVKFMHNKGIIYRDLKLDNIMIDHKGHIRLVDFGMCQGRIYREDLLPSNFCGTPEYMAPEIIKGVKYNQSVDFWSFGVVIYEMVVGNSPFHGTDEDELLWNVCHEEVVYPRYLSDNIKNLLVLLLNKNADQRLGMPGCSAGDILSQPYFKGVDWLKVEKCQMKPPFVPELSCPTDVRYFEPYFTKEIPNLTPVSEDIILTMDQTLFQGFSYTNHRMTD